jgi:hypothetical protein
MTEAIATRRLTAEEARDLTDEVKADAATLWRKLLRLYEGEAHLALGFKTWGAYYTANFGGSGSRGRQLLVAGRVVRAIEEHAQVTNGTRPSEGVARELAPVLANGGPEAVADTWQEAVEEFGPTPTAREVREVVRPVVPARKTRVALPEVMTDHDEAWTECRARFASGDIGAALESALLAGRALGRVIRTLDGMSTETGG